jgi:hypothetical protein
VRKASWSEEHLGSFVYRHLLGSTMVNMLEVQSRDMKTCRLWPRSLAGRSRVVARFNGRRQAIVGCYLPELMSLKLLYLIKNGQAAKQEKGQKWKLRSWSTTHC